MKKRHYKRYLQATLTEPTGRGQTGAAQAATTRLQVETPHLLLWQIQPAARQQRQQPQQRKRRKQTQPKPGPYHDPQEGLHEDHQQRPK